MMLVPMVSVSMISVPMVSVPIISIVVVSVPMVLVPVVFVLQLSWFPILETVYKVRCIMANLFLHFSDDF